MAHYWATNRQNPTDEVGSMNASTHFCEITYGGYYDNITMFNRGTAYINLVGPQDIDYSLYSVPYTWAIRLNITEIENSSIFTIGSAEYGSFTLGSNLSGAIYINASDDGAFWSVGATSDSDTIGTGDYMIFLSRDTSGTYRIHVNEVLVVEYLYTGTILLNNDDIKLGAHYSFINDKGLFGGIEEIGMWDYVLSAQDMVDWIAKTERPFGGEVKYALPCAAIDKPVILSNKARRIYCTDYFGEKEFNWIEYQVFNRFDITYTTPILEELLTTQNVALIQKGIDSKDYKVRVRYYDIDNNKSMWSRPIIFNVYFIPPSTHSFLLTENKDSIGLTGVTQYGTPEVASGYCQFASSDYFSFDRLTFDSGSISFWVKFDDLDTNNGGAHTMIMGGNDTDNKSYIWYNVSNNQIRITDEGQAQVLYSNTFNGVVDQWYNIIITMDQYESNIYIDMMDMGSGESIPVLLDNLGTAYLGGVYDFIGGIKGFRKFENVLTHDERLDVFQEYD